MAVVAQPCKTRPDRIWGRLVLFGRRLSGLKLSASVLAPTRVLRMVTAARASLSLGVCESSWQVEVPSGQPFRNEKRRLDMRV
jgi:hypothetical protein